MPKAKPRPAEIEMCAEEDDEEVEVEESGELEEEEGGAGPQLPHLMPFPMMMKSNAGRSTTRD